MPGSSKVTVVSKVADVQPSPATWVAGSFDEVGSVSTPSTSRSSSRSSTERWKPDGSKSAPAGPR